MKDKKVYYAIKLPTVLLEMFQQRVMDYRFSGIGDVINYLMESYCLLHETGKVSKTVKRVFSHKDKDWIRLFRYDGKTYMALQTSNDLAIKMTRIAKAQGYSTRNSLNNAIIASFVSSAHATLRNLCAEMDNGKIVTEITGSMISTYVSDYQYMFLRTKAKEQRISLINLLNSTADFFIQMENENREHYTPDMLRKIAIDALNVKGCTTKDFRREKAVCISVNEEKIMNILHIMRKYQIRTPREFLRRIVLFFLKAQYLIYKDSIVCDELLPEDDNQEYEDYFNEQCARKDFVYSLYTN